MYKPLGGRVLLVEDDEGDAVLVRELLAEAASNVEIVWEQTLADAQRRVAAENIACILLDLGLPDAHGLEALTGLRQSGRPVVVLTGEADQQRGIDSLGAGAQEYLVKGQVDGEVLYRAIRYAVERTQAEAGARELLEARLAARENSRLERGLLPKALIRDESVRIATTYRPGRRRALLGGDFYDAVELDDGSVLVLIGDVCGHGPDEAALGVSLRIAWRALVLAHRTVEEVLAVLDQVLEHERHADLIFATVALVRLWPDRDHADLYLAGHPPPVLLGQDRPITVTPTSLRPPLGVPAGAASAGPTRIELDGVSSLLLYTDGLIDGRIGEGSERLGIHGLLRLLARARPTSSEEDGALLGRLLAEVEDLNGGDLTDDVALVLLSWR